MNEATRKRLLDAGHEEMTVQEFLGLSDEEMQLVELRLALGKRLRSLRERLNMTQLELAKKIKSSQSRIAKMEAASADVSLDQLFKGFFAVGGQVVDIGRRFDEPKSKKSSTTGKRAGGLGKKRTREKSGTA